MSKYLERKAKLVAKYNTDIPEITQEQLDWIRDNYDSKAHGTGIDWTVVAHVIDENTLMLRYVVAHKYLREDLSIEERARLVLSENQKPIMFERWHSNNPNDEWKNTRCCYFRECSHDRYWTRQWFCCRDTQKVAPGVIDDIKKLSDLKYLDVTQYLNQNSWICIEDTIKHLLGYGLFYEKLEKIGMGWLAEYNFKAYERDLIHINRKETSIFKMLGINRRDFNIINQCKDPKCIKTLQLNSNITEKELEYARSHKWDGETIKNLRDTGVNTNKALSYIEKNKISAREWLHYVSNLKELEYQLDNSYLFPRDFYREDRRVADEIVYKANALEHARRKEKDNKIKQLADAMRADKAFMEFFAGSEGLVVKVPESAEELYIEGKKLHNCLGTYVDRVAEGKSLIFFVRKIEEPDKPFIAMEYSNGKIIQCRYDYNEEVKEDKIINFVNLLADRLRERRAA